MLEPVTLRMIPARCRRLNGLNHELAQILILREEQTNTARKVQSPDTKNRHRVYCTAILTRYPHVLTSIVTSTYSTPRAIFSPADAVSMPCLHAVYNIHRLTTLLQRLLHSSRCVSLNSMTNSLRFLSTSLKRQYLLYKRG